MSQESVELVRDLLEAFRRRDHELAFDFYDPDIVWEAARTFVDGDMERLPSLYTPDAKITAVPEGWPESGPYMSQSEALAAAGRSEQAARADS